MVDIRAQPAFGYPLEEALVNLRTARCGGQCGTPYELEERLRAFDFAEIEAFSPAVPIRFVVARRSP